MKIVKESKKLPILADMVPGEAFKFLTGRPAMIATTKLAVHRDANNILVVFLDTAEIMQAPLTTPVQGKRPVRLVQYDELQWGDFFQTQDNGTIYLLVGTNEEDESVSSRVIDAHTGEEVEIEVDDFTKVVVLNAEVRISGHQEGVS